MAVCTVGIMSWSRIVRMPVEFSVISCSYYRVVVPELKKPLMCRLQELQGVTPLPANCPSQAIVDVSENMRAKIFALFGKIGTSCCMLVDIIINLFTVTITCDFCRMCVGLKGRWALHSFIICMHCSGNKHLA